MTASGAFTNMIARKARANLGKDSEAAVRKALEAAGIRLGVRFQAKRVLDARAFRAKNFTGPGVIGDFEMFFDGGAAYIEVKETTADTLPAKNFSRNQIARCYLRSLAGCPVWVLVHHKNLNEWRALPIKKFFDEVKTKWDTSEAPRFYNAQEAVAFVIKQCFNV